MCKWKRAVCVLYVLTRTDACALQPACCKQTALLDFVTQTELRHCSVEANNTSHCA